MPRERPTILQIIPRLDTGGAERAVVEIAAALTRAGARALVVSEPGRMSRLAEAAGAEMITLPVASKNPVRILLNARAIADIIRREAVDIVHARSRAPAWSALIAARKTGTPFVTTYHGIYGERGPVKRLYNSVMARSDIVIANSRYTADLIEARYGTPRDRIRVIHRGIDGEAFAPERVSPDRISALEARFGLAPGQPMILHAARLTSWKGQGILIDAAAGLAEAGRLGQAVVILAGDAQGRDGYAGELAAKVAAVRLGDRVRIVGHVADIAAAYVRAHVTVVASTKPEAFGRAATEAMAMGCPVIATDIGAPPETILAAPSVGAEAATGWLVSPADAAALADALAAALGLEPEVRRRMGDRAREHVRRHFTVESMQRQTLAAYDELLGSALGASFDAASNAVPAPANAASNSVTR